MSESAVECKAYPPLIAIYDFDDTVYNANSDDTAFRGVSEELAELLFNECTYRFDNWQDAVDYTLGVAHTKGYNLADFRTALLRDSLSPGIRETIMTFGAAGVPQFICSDGNTAFINLLLHANGLSQYFPPEHIFANPASFDETGRLRVKYFHRQSLHSACNANMCKGCVLHKIWSSEVLTRPFEPIPFPSSNSNPVVQVAEDGTMLNEIPELVNKTKDEVHAFYAEFIKARHTSKWIGVEPSSTTIRPYAYRGRTIYFGDGGNDMCAAKQLGPNDFVAVREGYMMYHSTHAMFESGAALGSSDFPTDYDAFTSRLTRKNDGVIRATRLLWGERRSTSGKNTLLACHRALEAAGLSIPEQP